MPSEIFSASRRTGDPLLDTFSPLAQYSSQTLREHNETLERLRAQQEAIAVQSAQLANQESEDNKRHLRILDALSREEAEVLRLLQLNKAHIQDLEKRSMVETTSRQETIQIDSETMRDLEEELVSQVGLEGELRQMERSILDKLALVTERSRMFGREFEQGMSLLQQDRNDVRVLAAHTNSRLGQSPSRIREAVNASAQLPRVPIPPPEPQQSSRAGQTVSEFLRERSLGATAHTSNSFSSTSMGDSGAFVGQLRASGASMVSPERPGKTHQVLAQAQASRADLKQPVSTSFSNISSVANGESSARATASATSFNAVGGLLMDACSRSRLDVTEITNLLRADPNAVNYVDVSGSQPLHAACASPGFSIPAIQALLLAGASATAMNGEGLTPLHVACRNTKDHGDHSLKRFLIFSAGQDPNQRTARGETAAHLCAASDDHLDSLRFLSRNLDLNITALLTDLDGTPRRMTALDKAKAAGGRALRCRAYLESIM
jgi:hypothetical protein